MDNKKGFWAIFSAAVIAYLAASVFWFQNDSFVGCVWIILGFLLCVIVIKTRLSRYDNSSSGKNCDRDCDCDEKNDDLQP